MLSTHDVAQALQTDDKTTRRFLRTVFPHEDNQRWQIPEEDLDMIKLLYLVKRLGKEDMLRLMAGPSLDTTLLKAVKSKHDEQH